jgi:ATP adenylyltransferase
LEKLKKYRLLTNINLLQRIIMQKIYAPWRAAYIKDAVKKEKKGCVFCTQLSDTTKDAEYFILQRYEHCAVMLNLYPYNAGHLMVIPYAHQSKLEKLPQEARAEMMEAVSTACTLLTQTLKAESLNIGINFGASAGGGIPEHLHIHVLPRWNGDTNFMPLLCDTKPISTDLQEIFELLKNAYQARKQ